MAIVAGISKFGFIFFFHQHFSLQITAFLFVAGKDYNGSVRRSGSHR